MTSKFDWRALVGTVAPAIATSLGGPLAGIATNYVAKALGIEGDPATLEGQIESRLANATHSDLLALKTADQEYEVSMRELDVKETGLHLTGMSDARAAHKDRWEPFAIFCILTVVSCSGFVGIIQYSPEMSDATKGMLLPIYGALVYKWLDCVAYYVGTTRSSAAKTALLAK